MEVKNYFAQDDKGNILPNASVYLYKKGTNELVSVFDKNGSQKTNPFTAESNGLVQFSAADGEYDLRISSGGRDYKISISLLDTLRLHFERICVDMGLTLAAGSFEEGSILTSPMQALLCRNQNAIYTWNGGFNKIVAEKSTPDSAGGIGVSAWIEKTTSQIVAGRVLLSTGRAPFVNTRTVEDLMLDGEAGLKKNFGAKGNGSSDDTFAFNDWWDCLLDGAYKRQTAKDDEPSWMLQKGPKLLIENGEFIYEGSGFDINLSSSFVLNVRGESMLSTKIVLQTGKYLFDLTNSPVHTELTDLTCSGGRGLIRFKSKSRNTAREGANKSVI